MWVPVTQRSSWLISASRGGNNGGQAVYELPLTSTPTNGKLSVGRGIGVASEGNFHNVKLTIDSSTGSAATLNQNGSLQIAAAHDAVGEVIINNVDMSFTGEMYVAGQPDTWRQTGRLEINDSVINNAGHMSLGDGGGNTVGTLKLRNSTLNIWDMKLGGNRSGGADWGRGEATLDIGPNSQLNMSGQSLFIGGSNNDATQRVYNLPLTNTPTNGMLSAPGASLRIAETENNKVRLNINQGNGTPASLIQGGIGLAQGRYSTGELYIDNVDITLTGGRDRLLELRRRHGRHHRHAGRHHALRRHPGDDQYALRHGFRELGYFRELDREYAGASRPSLHRQPRPRRRPPRDSNSQRRR